MFVDKKIAFIGPGVMAEAMIAGLIRKGVAGAENMAAGGPSAERLEHLRERYHIAVSADNTACASPADVVVLAVKPQRLERVMAGLKGKIKPGALVLSIIAGASIEKISAGLGHNIVVRSMPNTPAQIGEGITVWTAAPQVSQEQLDMSRQMLKALGEEIFVEEENYLDMATALSGTGRRMCSCSWRRWSMPGYTLASHGALPSSLWRRRCAARWISTARTRSTCTWRACATRSPHREAPRRRRCTTWKKPASARRSHVRFGRHTSAPGSWAKGGRAMHPRLEDKARVKA